MALDPTCDTSNGSSTSFIDASIRTSLHILYADCKFNNTCTYYWIGLLDVDIKLDDKVT